MRIWRHVQEDGLVLEEVLPGAPVDDILFLEFDCPGCEEFHSITCDCYIDHNQTFLCGCVPTACPSCGHRLHSETAISLAGGRAIEMEEPSYK